MDVTGALTAAGDVSIGGEFDVAGNAAIGGSLQAGNWFLASNTKYVCT